MLARALVGASIITNAMTTPTIFCDVGIDRSEGLGNGDTFFLYKKVAVGVFLGTLLVLTNLFCRRLLTYCAAPRLVASVTHQYVNTRESSCLDCQTCVESWYIYFLPCDEHPRLRWSAPPPYPLPLYKPLGL